MFRIVYGFFSKMHFVSTVMTTIIIALYFIIVFGLLLDINYEKKMDGIFYVLYLLILNTTIYGILYQDCASIITDFIIYKRGVFKKYNLYFKGS